MLNYKCELNINRLTCKNKDSSGTTGAIGVTIATSQFDQRDDYPDSMDTLKSISPSVSRSSTQSSRMNSRQLSDQVSSNISQKTAIASTAATVNNYSLVNQAMDNWRYTQVAVKINNDNSDQASILYLHRCGWHTFLYVSY